MKNNLTPQQINNLTYTEFIGLINQWNVPPGAYSTLSKWKIFGNINSASDILEVACTTGFSLRELALMTGCSGKGIDISETSVESAKKNKLEYASKSKINYEVCDAIRYHDEAKYSHIIFGAALRFFPSDANVLEKFLNFLKPNGLILSCEFYCNKKIPQYLVEKAKKVFGMEITQVGYKDVMSIYEGLTLLYEDRNSLFKETEKELKYYCDSTIEKFSEENPNCSVEALRSMGKRLLEIKEMSNSLRPFQSYTVLVHSKDNRFYPRRYVELF